MIDAQVLRTWILPPLIGAVIGYFTNWLAIKMLFRPLRPLHIGRMRVPFTPGILPRERLRLADNVGDTVAKELLTPEVFRIRLEDPLLRAKVEESVGTVIDGFLAQDLGSIFSGAGGLRDSEPGGNGDRTPDGIRRAAEKSDLGALVSGTLVRVVSAPQFRTALSEGMAEAVREAGTMPASSILSPEALGRFANSVVGRLSNAESRDLVKAFAARILNGGERGEALIPRERVAALLGLSAKVIYSRLVPAVESLLEGVEIRASLARMGMDVVRREIARLAPLQRLIVGAANYEKRLEETMPDMIADLVALIAGVLEDPATMEKVALSVETRVREGPAGTNLLSLADLGEALEAFLSGLGEDRENFASRIAERYSAVADRPLSEVFPSMFRLFAELGSRLADASHPHRAGTGESGAAEALLKAGWTGFKSSMLERGGAMTLGELLGWGRKERDAAAASLAGAIVLALSSQSERLIAALDVRSMVVERLNALDMADVERIILGVVKRELSWITILGGVLGAIIGMAQGLLSLF